MSINKAANVPNVNSMWKIFISAMAIMMSENADVMTATQGTKSLNMMNIDDGH